MSQHSDENLRRRRNYLFASIRRFCNYLKAFESWEGGDHDLKMRYDRAERDYLDLREHHFNLQLPNAADDYYMQEVENAVDKMTSLYCQFGKDRKCMCQCTCRNNYCNHWTYNKATRMGVFNYPQILKMNSF